MYILDGKSKVKHTLRNTALLSPLIRLHEYALLCLKFNRMLGRCSDQWICMLPFTLITSSCFLKWM